jgi:hypothetical protein
VNDIPNSTAPDQESLAGAIRDVSSRVPSYAKLSASLAREGAMGADSSSPLTQVLGQSGFGRLARWVPQLRQLDRTLRSIGALRHALDEMQSDRAEVHLQRAGLTREQIERDHATLASVGRRLSDDIARNARTLLHGSAHHAGRLTGNGLRALRRWKKQWDES